MGKKTTLLHTVFAEEYFCLRRKTMSCAQNSTSIYLTSMCDTLHIHTYIHTELFKQREFTELYTDASTRLHVSYFMSYGPLYGLHYVYNVLYY